MTRGLRPPGYAYALMENEEVFTDQVPENKEDAEVSAARAVLMEAHGASAMLSIFFHWTGENWEVAQEGVATDPDTLKLVEMISNTVEMAVFGDVVEADNIVVDTEGEGLIDS